MGNESNILRWRFDVSTFRLIGRDLITDRVTALFELIKNCYDANATEVTVTFENVGVNSDSSVITIKDNGIGMSFEDIRDKWMVIGTSNKRRNPLSPDPYRRRCVGEKGIGRFAVDKLGDHLNICTKQTLSKAWLSVDIDWKKYFNQSYGPSEKIRLFTDVENTYDYISAKSENDHGTILTIVGVRDVWEKKDIIRLLRESSRIVSPFEKTQYPFNIHVLSPEYSLDSWSDEYKVDGRDLATVSATITARDGKQECLLFNEATGEIDVKLTDLQIFGEVSMQLYYFNGNARNSFRKRYPEATIDGVKIYRDGIITTPFAEQEEDSDKKRDILGIDKRMWKNLFDKVSTRELIGIVDITKDGNPEIIDATNRQDFTATPEYTALKEFILHQIEAFDQKKVYQRNHQGSEQTKKIQKIGSEVAEIVQQTEELIKTNPELAEQLSKLKSIALQAGKGIETAVKEQQDAEEENARHENMYLRIMSRHEDAINVTHAVKTSMHKIERQANFFNNRFPNESLNEYFQFYAKQIFNEMKNLDRATNEIFDYSKTNIPFTDVDIKQLVEYLLLSFSEQFENEGITLEMNIADNLILNCNEMFFYDIVQNLTNNAIKAMKDSETKIYRCTVSAHDDKLVMDFSDTGCGIPVEKREWVFGIYNTTTAEHGGGGIGLYAVRMRVKALNGMVKVQDSEFAPLGATIHIELPFKK
ncbi:MAG: ATP-binding protein [Bacteroidales bacterium]|nr:ATP-binding protein [Bacteroidales bacterium]